MIVEKGNLIQIGDLCDHFDQYQRATASFAVFAVLSATFYPDTNPDAVAYMMQLRNVLTDEVTTMYLYGHEFTVL